MLHRIRQAWATTNDGGPFSGPVEVDETYMGGRRANMSNAKRKALADTGCGPVGKTAVVGAKDRTTNRVRAKVVESTDAATLKGFVAGFIPLGFLVGGMPPVLALLSALHSPGVLITLPLHNAMPGGVAVMILIGTGNGLCYGFASFFIARARRSRPKRG